MPEPRVPYDQDAEEALLNACLLSVDGIRKAEAAGVTPASFYVAGHGPVYAAIITTHEAGHGVDPVTVGNNLNGHLPNGIDGKALLKRLAEPVHASANAAGYARIVAEKHLYRQQLGLLDQARAAIYDGADPSNVFHQLGDTPTTLATSWTAIDGGILLEGALETPAPIYLRREDGLHLIYRGLVHSFQGEPESLKSWLALLAIQQTMSDDHNVVYLDFEDTPESIYGRLRNLGCDDLSLRTQLSYIRPDEPFTGAAPGLIDRLIAEKAPALAVIDGVTEAMTLDGLDLMDNKDVATWLAALPRRIADLGVAVILIDHVTKSKDDRGRWGIGAQHKMAGIHVAYTVETIIPAAPAIDTPVTGISRITVVKDRPGGVRSRIPSRKHVGTFELTAYPDHGVTGHLVPATERPEEGTTPTHIMESISKYLTAQSEPMSRNAIHVAIQGRAITKNYALELLINKGYIVEETGPRGAILNRLVHPYTEENDHHPDDD